MLNRAPPGVGGTLRAAQSRASWHTFRAVVAGIALAAAGVLLIIATHRGHFG